MMGHAPLSRFLLPAFAILVAGCASNPKIPGYLADHPSVIEINPVEHSYGVEQFGMPRDAQLVFCNADDCAARTLKHLPAPIVPASLPMPVPTLVVAPQAKAESAPLPAVQPLAVDPRLAMSPAKPVPRKKHLSRHRRKHPTCKPE